MDASLISNMRAARRVLRAVAGVVVIAFTGLVTAPAVAAVKQANQQAAMQASLVPSDEAEFNRVLLKIKATLEKFDKRLARAEQGKGEKGTLNSLDNRLRQLVKSVRKRFERDDALVREKALPAEVLSRVTQARDEFDAGLASLQAYLGAIQDAADVSAQAVAVRAALDYLDSLKLQRTHQMFDPNNLPVRNHQPDPERKPKLKPAEFRAAGLFDTPYQQVAALGDFTFDNLRNANNPAYLAESDEVVLTDAVKAKAAELGHDPVKIYHWVRNNVDFIPSWGSMQNADLTLSSQRGNAFDISSLLISLLRASGIPARYVHGTVELTEDRFRNWVGGFEDLASAANYAASGGIPTAIASKDGVAGHVQLEHIWVEAAIDFLPSRGAVNKDADTWVPLDASFKQYEYLPGLDALAISGIDAEQLANDFAASGTINETEGWVAGFDPTILQNAQQQAQTALENHITQNMTDPTVGDVIGGAKTIIKTAPVLPSGVPMTVLATGARYDHVPIGLQHRLSVAFGDPLALAQDAPYTASYATLNNQKVTLSFRPATPTDEATLQALLPEGEITDISQLPSSISAYLIQVVPELKVNAEVVHSGSAMSLGDELGVKFTQHDPARGDFNFNSPIQGGSYLALTAVAGSVSPKAIQDLQVKLVATKAALESEDLVQAGALSREDLLGDMFHAGTLGYFAQFAAMMHIAGVAENTRTQLSPSIGTYGYVPKVNYLFGLLPSSISQGGAEMDLDSVAFVGVSDYTTAGKRKGFNQQVGTMSSTLEHLVPEEMFRSAQSNSEGVSAVRALQKAAASGQRIYQITVDNQETALPNLRHDSGTMVEIHAAVAAGLEVITHTDPIAVPGWEGSGYLILDPNTGVGAYKISGGLNGGWYTFLAVDTAILLGIVVGFPSLLVSVVLIRALVTIFAVEIILALAKGVDFGEFQKEIDFVEFVALALSLFGPLAKVALALGAVGLAYFSVAAYLAFILVFGVISFRKS